MTNWRKKSLWSVSGRFASAGLSFVSNVILVRLMEQDDLGFYFLGLSFSWGAALISQWGLSTLVVKWIAQARSRDDQAEVASSVWSAILFTVFQSIGLAMIISIPELPLYMKVTWAVWTLSIALQNLMPEILRGFDDIKWASLLLGPVPQAITLGILGVFYLFKIELGFRQTVSIVVSANMISALLGLALLIKRVPLRAKLKAYLPFLKESSPIALSLASTYLLSQADLWVCGVALSQTEVAVYGVAQRLVVFVSMPMMVLGAVSTPTMAQLLASAEHEKLQSVLRKAINVSALAAMVIYAVGVVIGYPVIVKLFGPLYADAYALFLILGAGQLFHVFAGPNGYLLLMSGQQRSAMRATMISALLLLCVGLVAVRYAGIFGVATASASALIIQTAWMWYSVRKRLGFTSHVKMSKSGA